MVVNELLGLLGRHNQASLTLRRRILLHFSFNMKVSVAYIRAAEDTTEPRAAINTQAKAASAKHEREAGSNLGF